MGTCTIVHIHNILIKSLSNPHDDLPRDMQLSAQLIVDGHIFLQMMPVVSEPSDCWKLVVNCRVPHHAHTFLLAIMRHSRSRGTRLLGSIAIGRDAVLLSIKKDSRFCSKLAKVNADGPCLDFQAHFSISESTITSSGLSDINIPANQVSSLTGEMVMKHMTPLCNQTNTSSLSSSSELWTMHEKILFLPNTDAIRLRAPLLHLLGKMCFHRYERSQGIEDLNQAICAYRDAMRDGLVGGTISADLGSALLWHFVIVGDLRDIDMSVKMLEDAVRLTADDKPEQPSRLTDLGNALRRRFEKLGDLGDLNRSIVMLEKVAQLTAENHPERPWIVKSLGQSLWCRFERLGHATDIDKSVLMFEDALRLAQEADPRKPGWLHSLGTSLLRRFERLGNPQDLKKSIPLLEVSLQSTPEDHPDRPLKLTCLSGALSRSFEQFGDLKDLNRSILFLQHAVQLTPNVDPQKCVRVTNLSSSLRVRFEQLGDRSDIDQSISMLEGVLLATAVSHPERPATLTSLGNILFRRSERLGKSEDIDRSISTLEEALQLTSDDDPAKVFQLSSLGNSLLCRFEQSGDTGDINKSILRYTKALEMTSEDNPKKASLLFSLATALAQRFKRFGYITDINQSIALFGDSVRLTPDGHTEAPTRLSSLGSALRARFQRFGDPVDVHMSVKTLEDGVRLTPDNHHSKPSMLNDLGNAFLDRFERLGEALDLNESVSVLTEAFKLVPTDHTHRPFICANLGNSLRLRFQELGDPWDVTRSVLMFQSALQLVPEGHTERPLWLSNLGFSLSLRFEGIGDINDLEKSISIIREAIKLAPEGHPLKPMMFCNLANSLRLRFGRVKDSNDLDELISQFTAAACSTTGPATVRFQACSMWAKYAQTSQHPSLLNAYSAALDLLPEMAWLGLSIGDRHHRILEAGEMVRDAAAAAISASRNGQAVEWLEQGRSIIWGQLLNLRTPVDALRESHPGLAEDLVRLSTLLEGAGLRDGAEKVMNQSTQQLLPSLARRYHDNAHERDELLKKIRALDGFHSFLLPKKIAELSRAATGGPIVILNISKIRCDALAVMPGGSNKVLCVPLPDLTNEHAQALGESFRTLLRDTGRSNRLVGQREGQVPPETEFSEVLSDLWVRIVKPVLAGLGYTAPARENLQRIWWCPTGPLAFLPIHAAGLYGARDSFGSKLSDFVISSYTPSLTALIEGFRSGSASQGIQLLTVAQPSAVDQNYIPGTRDEINRIEQLASGKLAVSRLEKDTATVINVEKGMKESHWVHFACHGKQDLWNPTESALLLAGNSRLTLSSIIKLSIPHADLAFLSACQTATGTNALQEESVHLAAGMLIAGYRGVIATMWSISDRDAPQVAADVYGHLFKTSPPDSTGAAEALHLAIQKLRQDSGRKKSFFHWVPFIHYLSGTEQGRSFMHVLYLSMPRLTKDLPAAREDDMKQICPASDEEG
ncbi:TPR-like protein [Mycena latifolia]|nr:TPR-like protein [Mycena latifolia]